MPRGTHWNSPEHDTPKYLRRNGLGVLCQLSPNTMLGALWIAFLKSGHFSRTLPYSKASSAETKIDGEKKGKRRFGILDFALFDHGQCP